MTTIYGLQDPMTGVIRYVGKSKSPQRRLDEHLKPTNPHTGKRVKRWVAALAKRGRRPVLIELQTCNESDAASAEVEWIQRLNHGDRLLNTHLGLPSTKLPPLARKCRIRVAMTEGERRQALLAIRKAGVRPRPGQSEEAAISPFITQAIFEKLHRDGLIGH